MKKRILICAGLFIVCWCAFAQGNQAVPYFSLESAFTAPSPVQSVAFSPDGARVVVGCINEFAIYTRRGEMLYQIPMRPKAFEPKIPLPEDGAPLPSEKPLSNPVFGLSYSPDGKKIAAIAGELGAGVWDEKTGKMLYPLPPHQKGTRCLRWSHDGKIIATGGNDGLIKFWDAETGKKTRELKEHQLPVLSIAFTKEGGLVSVAAKNFALQATEIKRWPADKLQSENTFIVDAVFPATANLSPFGNALTSQGNAKIPRRAIGPTPYIMDFSVWDARTGNLAFIGQNMVKGLRGHVEDLSRVKTTHVAFSSDESVVAAAGVIVPFTKGDSFTWGAYIFRVADNQFVGYIDTKRIYQGKDGEMIPLYLGFSPANDIVFGQGTRIEIWSVKN